MAWYFPKNGANPRLVFTGARPTQWFQLTIGGWFYFKEYTAGGSNLISVCRADTAFYAFRILLGETGYLRADAVINGTQVNQAISTSLTPLNRWVHVCARSVASNDVRLYMNGAEVARGTTSVGWAGTPSVCVVGSRFNAADSSWTFALQDAYAAECFFTNFGPGEGSIQIMRNMGPEYRIPNRNLMFHLLQLNERGGIPRDTAPMNSLVAASDGQWLPYDGVRPSDLPPPSTLRREYISGLDRVGLQSVPDIAYVAPVEVRGFGSNRLTVELNRTVQSTEDLKMIFAQPGDGLKGVDGIPVYTDLAETDVQTTGPYVRTVTPFRRRV